MTAKPESKAKLGYKWVKIAIDVLALLGLVNFSIAIPLWSDYIESGPIYVGRPLLTMNYVFVSAAPFFLSLLWFVFRYAEAAKKYPSLLEPRNAIPLVVIAPAVLFIIRKLLWLWLDLAHYRFS